MEQIKLDLIPGKMPPTCHVSQYDDGRSIRLDLYEGGQVYTLGGTEVITLKVRKPDGNFITKSVTATLGNTYVTITTTEQMTAVAGMNLCELEVKRGGNTLGTMNFIMNVEMDPIDGASASQSVIENLQAMVDSALSSSTYVTELEDIRTGFDGTVYDSAGDAVRLQGGAVSDIFNIGLFLSWRPGTIRADGTYTTGQDTKWQFTSSMIRRSSFDKFVIVPGDNRQANVCYFDDTGAFISRTAWSTSPITVDNTYNAILNVSLVTADATTYTIADMLNNIKILLDRDPIRSVSFLDCPIVDYGYIPAQQTLKYVKAERVYLAQGVTLTAKTGFQFGIYSNGGILVTAWTSSYTMATKQDLATIVIRKEDARFDIIKEVEGLCLSDYVEGSVYSFDLPSLSFTSKIYKEIQANMNFFNRWQNKKVAFVGDSITAGVNTSKIYYQVLNEMIGFSDLYADGVAGSCYSVTSDYGSSIVPISQRWQNIPTDRDLVVIFAGTNDWGHDTPIGSIDDTTDISLYGAIASTIIGIITANPSVRLVLMLPLHRWGWSGAYPNDTDLNGQGLPLKGYVDAIKSIAETYGIPVIDLFAESGFNPRIPKIKTDYVTDGLHPNTTGHYILANRIAPRLSEL